MVNTMARIMEDFIFICCCLIQGNYEVDILFKGNVKLVFLINCASWEFVKEERKGLPKRMLQHSHLYPRKTKATISLIPLICVKYLTND